MINRKYLIALLLSFSFTAFTSLLKSQEMDCIFEQIDDNMDGLIDDDERILMDSCTQNSYLTIPEIKSNIIGEWKLIGHGEGWFSFPSEPCSFVTISPDHLIFEFVNEQVDTIINATWEIEETDWWGGTYFTLETTPAILDFYMNCFSSNYMFGDATPADGNMYLYEKVESNPRDAVYELAGLSLSVFPNPTTDYINIAISGDLNYTVRLFDSNGNLVKLADNSSKISIIDLPQGLYLIELQAGNSGKRIIDRVIKI